MHANCPKSLRFFYRRPKLLRNPSDPSALDRNPRKSVGEQPYPLAVQSQQRVPVKAVTRRNPNAWIEAVAAKNRQAGSNPLLLRIPRYPAELSMEVQRQQALSNIAAKMLVAMQGDRRPRRFHRPHARPELWVRSITHQSTVAVVGDHRQNRLDCKFLDERKKPLPPAPRKRRTKIVETKQILRRPGNQIAASQQVFSAWLERRLKQQPPRPIPKKEERTHRPQGRRQCDACNSQPAHQQ